VKTTIWLAGCGLLAMVLAAPSGVAGCGGPSGGSGGGASGGSNAASTSAGTGTAGSGTGCSAYPGAVFCDDFENASTFDANWPLITGTPPMVTTSPTAYSPTHVASAIASGSFPSNMGHPLPPILKSQRLRIAFSFRVLDGLSGGQMGYLGTYQGDLLLTATAADIDYDDVVIWKD
jgi:hypothetical protein